MGSNLGDSLGLLRAAVLLLAGTRLVRLRAVSSAWLTEPVGERAGAGPYLNAVVACRFRCGPSAALALCRAVERALGQHRPPAGLPRLIDVDILLWGDRVIRLEGLTVPHPRMQERRFVLAPACEIRPGTLHPLAGVTLGELLEALPPRPGALRLHRVV